LVCRAHTADRHRRPVPGSEYLSGDTAAGLGFEVLAGDPDPMGTAPHSRNRLLGREIEAAAGARNFERRVGADCIPVSVWSELARGAWILQLVAGPHGPVEWARFPGRRTL